MRSGRATCVCSREHDALLSVGRANPVTLQVRSRAAAARVHDECPAAGEPSVRGWRVRLPATLRYTVTPRRRGELRFEQTVIRADGPLRLGWRQFRAGDGETIPVEADIAAVREYEALARRGQLVELGIRSMRTRGDGTEFERVRDAVPDDPLRSVNWKATARTGRLMATDLMPERAQPVVLLLDAGRLMGVGAGELTKFDHAVNAALLLAHVALRSGDRAGLIAFADSVTVALPARGGSLHAAACAGCAPSHPCRRH